MEISSRPNHDVRVAGLSVLALLALVSSDWLICRPSKDLCRRQIDPTSASCPVCQLLSVACRRTAARDGYEVLAAGLHSGWPNTAPAVLKSHYGHELGRIYHLRLQPSGRTSLELPPPE